MWVSPPSSNWRQVNDDAEAGEAYKSNALGGESTCRVAHQGGEDWVQTYTITPSLPLAWDALSICTGALGWSSSGIFLQVESIESIVLSCNMFKCVQHYLYSPGFMATLLSYCLRIYRCYPGESSVGQGDWVQTQVKCKQFLAWNLLFNPISIRLHRFVQFHFWWIVLTKQTHTLSQMTWHQFVYIQTGYTRIKTQCDI